MGSRNKGSIIFEARGKKEDGSLVCNKPLFGIYMPNNYENFVDVKESKEADKS